MCIVHFRQPWWHHKLTGCYGKAEDARVGLGIAQGNALLRMLMHSYRLAAVTLLQGLEQNQAKAGVSAKRGVPHAICLRLNR